MLAESIIRVGRPIKNSDLSPRERIRLLTDVSSDNCKNFFRHVLLIEIDGKEVSFQILQLGALVIQDKKEDFEVDQRRNTAFPIFYPNGGNPLHAQGIYPLSCYLMYDPHIKALQHKEQFKKDFLLPRLNNTIGYKNLDIDERNELAEKISTLLCQKATAVIEKDKQLGIFMIYDEKFSTFKKLDKRIEDESLIWIAASKNPNLHLYLDGPEALKRISLAKYCEAAELGKERNMVSTFSNQHAADVVSIYNKSWLWLSPTWEMPRSIYWQANDWTKGIKVDFESYESFFYGVQFLKWLQVPISSAILKEMFSPITSVEAKKNMSISSLESIYGIPIVLPLVDGDSQQIFTKYRRMLKKKEAQSTSDLHLEILAGMKASIIPESSDEHRLTILYYSGDLSRGNMHIRAVIEDVLPSVASKIQNILRSLRDKELKVIQAALGIKEQPVYRTESLPALLANAYGPAYVWSSLQAALHKEPLGIERLRTATAKKLNELANKQDFWQMKQELVFYYSFLFFLKQYEKEIIKQQRGVKTLTDWNGFMDAYSQGKIQLDDLKSVEDLGFASGLLVKQFSNSYYQKTKKDFVKQRVMKFGSVLTPEMVWKNGLLRCEELTMQWDMKIGGNFFLVLAQTLLGFLEKKDQLTLGKDEFMTAFWSGFLLYQKNHNTEGDENHDG